MINFREHRGSLGDSMRTAIVLDNREEVVAHIANLLRPYCVIKSEDVSFKPYGYDPRIDWQTLIVSVKDYGVVGFARELNEERADRG
jgi:hypothetical protein